MMMGHKPNDSEIRILASLTISNALHVEGLDILSRDLTTVGTGT